MKNLFGILCLIALFAVSIGASATPDILDTSPNIVCVDITPDLGTSVDYVAPAPLVADCFSPVFTVNIVSVDLDLPVPESPNIGFTDSNTDLDPDLGTETLADLPESPNIGFAYLSLATNTDPTNGESAECKPHNGANDLNTTLNTADLPESPNIGFTDPCVTNWNEKAIYPVGS
jgi:hypothetical protein